MTFLFTGVALDMAQVLGLVLIFLYNLGGINPNSWVISLLSFFLTFLGVGGLGLRLISRRRWIVRLSFFFVPVKSLVMLLPIGIIFFFFDQKLISFWIPGIDLLSSGG